MNAKRIVDGMVKTDSDAFLLEAKTVYRRVFFERRFTKACNAEEIKSKLGLNRDLLTSLACSLVFD